MTDNLTVYEVGKVFPSWGNGIPEGIHFQAWDSNYTITIIFKNPSMAEIESAKTGEAEFRFDYDVKNQVIWLYFKLGSIPWCDAPYNWHLNTIGKNDSDLWYPEQLQRSENQGLTITLVNQADGIIHALRLIAIPARFVNALNKAILRQSAAKFDMDAYNRAITQTYGEKTTEQMVKKYIERVKPGRS